MQNGTSERERERAECMTIVEYATSAECEMRVEHVMSKVKKIWRAWKCDRCGICDRGHV